MSARFSGSASPFRFDLGSPRNHGDPRRLVIKATQLLFSFADAADSGGIVVVEKGDVLMLLPDSTGLGSGRQRFSADRPLHKSPR